MIIYLYVKQHSITGLKYFGMTTKLNPFTYKGSGKYWSKHIKKHGRDYIKTLDVWGFDDQKLCTEFALKFSRDNNIVNSNQWANLIEEIGISGRIRGQSGSPRSEECRIKISEKALGRKSWNKGLTKENDPRVAKISQSLSGIKKNSEHIEKLKIPKSDEHKQKIKEIMNKDKYKNLLADRVRGIPRTEEQKHKQRLAMIGRPGANKGKPMSEESKRKLSESQKLRIAKRKELCP